MEFEAKIEIIGINPFVFVPDPTAGKDKGQIHIKEIINEGA